MHPNRPGILRSALPMLSVLGLLGVFGMAGCKDYPACRKAEDCKQELGETCVDKVCQNCASDVDCLDKTPAGEAPYVCLALRCTSPIAAAAEASAGLGDENDPCAQQAECLEGLACLAGVCSLCGQDADCASGTCSPDTQRCTSGGQCASDEQCAMDEICNAGACVFSGDLGDDDGGPCGLPAVFFAFDSDAISPKSQEQLIGLSQCLIDKPSQVYLEAHADDRGTIEYNILLTERRGRSVAQFIIDQGVPGQNLLVIAKGSLEAAGTDEAARTKDRRVQFIWP